jgi:hypothetical protein
MALTANYVPKYKGLVSSHPQLENSSIYDDGSIQTTQGRAIECTLTTTTPYVVLSTDELVVVNAAAVSGGASFVVNLPVAAGLGRSVMVKSINSRAVEVTPNGTDTIDGTNNAAIICFKGVVKLVDYAANKWVVVN